ncbi:MAG: hypothetical protein RBR08_16380 [Desulforegulaceae bacterium]|nr:hypothetical protein [Desulforegulaceae bacterium]
MNILYTFILEDKKQRNFSIDIDDKTITLIKDENKELPKWCELDFNKCSHCPFDNSQKHCPVAANLEQAVAFFSGIISYDKTCVIVKIGNRDIYCETSVQNGLKSLMGLLIATSKCPHTDFFKPMARFHLPFADSDETLWRSASYFLLQEYLKRLNSNDKSLSLEPLKKKYRDIEILNTFMAARLSGASKKDSAVNALISLDIFAKRIGPDFEKRLASILELYTY